MWWWPPYCQSEAEHHITRKRETVCVCVSVSPVVSLLPITPSGCNHGGYSSMTSSNSKSLSKGSTSKHHSWAKFRLSYKDDKFQHNKILGNHRMLFYLAI
jgi:hypothetical protein